MKIIDFDVTKLKQVGDNDNFHQELVNIYSKETNETDFINCPCHCVDFFDKCKAVQLSKAKQKGKHNYKVIEDALTNCKLDSGLIIAKYKKQCIEKRRNVCVFVFLFDIDITQRIYVAKMGFIPFDCNKNIMGVADMIAEPMAAGIIDPTEDADTVELTTFHLPCPKRGWEVDEDDEDEEGVEQVNVNDASEFIKLMAVVLCRKSGDKEAVAPTLALFTDCELSKKQRIMATNMLVISVCRNNQALDVIKHSLMQLVVDCDEMDKSFCMKRLVRANPYYKERCSNVSQICFRIEESISLIAAHYSQHDVWKTVPVAIKCFSHLLTID